MLLILDNQRPLISLFIEVTELGRFRRQNMTIDPKHHEAAMNSFLYDIMLLISVNQQPPLLGPSMKNASEPLGY